MKHKKKRYFEIISIFMILIILLTSCQLNPFNESQKQTPEASQQSYPVAEIFFAVTIPEPLVNGDNLYLSVVE